MLTMAVRALALALALVAVAASAQTIVVDGRPAALHLPPSYDGSTPEPLVLLLHGYGASGAVQEGYMRFAPLSDAFGFLYLTPDGTADGAGNRFWNATDACCDFDPSGVDDSGYLRRLIEQAKLDYNVDPFRIYLIGHSNGGFMSYRMACDHANTIAAIVSLAGATFSDPSDCLASEPMHVLQIHGTADATIAYAGGAIGGNVYPGAVPTTESWADRGGCSLVPDTSPPALDLDARLAGSETTVARYATGCNPDGSAELWTINGGTHIPTLSVDFSRKVIEFLYAHPSDSEEVEPLDLDSDDDGLSDAEEVAMFGTDPLSADSDGDGLPDGLEAGRTDPIPDPDGPGPRTATDPLLFVADSDPLTITDPTAADSDGGGVLDGAEDRNGNGAWDAGERDPTLGNGADDPLATCETTPLFEVDGAPAHGLRLSVDGPDVVLSWTAEHDTRPAPCIVYRVHLATAHPRSTDRPPARTRSDYALVATVTVNEYRHLGAASAAEDFDYLVSAHSLSAGEGSWGFGFDGASPVPR